MDKEGRILGFQEQFTAKTSHYVSEEILGVLNIVSNWVYYFAGAKHKRSIDGHSDQPNSNCAFSNWHEINLLLHRCVNKKVAAWVRVHRWSIAHIAVEICVARAKPQSILAYEPDHGRAKPACPVVVKASDEVFFPSRKPETV